MSIKNWDHIDAERLHRWVVKITTALVTQDRYDDVVKLMLTINEFENLGNTARQIGSSDRWVQESLSDLAYCLEDLEFRTGENMNQKLYCFLQNLSDFVQVNQISNSSQVAGIDLKIPAVSAPRLNLNF